MKILVPEGTPAAKLAALALEFDGVAIEMHEHLCASVDSEDVFAGCLVLSRVNGILWADEGSDWCSICGREGPVICGCFDGSDDGEGER